MKSILLPLRIKHYHKVEMFYVTTLEQDCYIINVDLVNLPLPIKIYSRLNLSKQGQHPVSVRGHTARYPIISKNTKHIKITL